MTRILTLAWIVGVVGLLAIPCGNDLEIIEWHYPTANEGCVDAQTSIEVLDGRHVIRCDWPCALDPLATGDGETVPGRVTYWIAVEGLVKRHWRRGCGRQV